MSRKTVIFILVALVFLGLLFYKQQIGSRSDERIKPAQVNEGAAETAFLAENPAPATEGPLAEKAGKKPPQSATLLDILRSPEAFSVSKEDIEAALKRVTVDEKVLLAAGLLLGNTPDGRKYIEQSFSRAKTRGSYIAMILSHPERADLLAEFRSFDSQNLVTDVLELKLHGKEDPLQIIKRLEHIRDLSREKTIDWDQTPITESMSLLLAAMGYEKEASEAIASLSFTLNLKIDSFPLNKMNFDFVSKYINEESPARNEMTSEDKIKALQALNHFLDYQPTLGDEIFKTTNDGYIADLEKNSAQSKMASRRLACAETIKTQYNKVFSDMTYVEASEYFKVSNKEGELQALVHHPEMHTILEQDGCLPFYTRLAR